MASVQCPRCNAITPNEPVSVNGYSFNFSGMSIVPCMGCSKAFIIEGERSVWPLTSPSSPEGVSEKVREAYEDARLALAAGAKIGALMAARTTLIRFLRDKNASNFKELVERQIITPAIYGAVDQLRLWADVVGHEDIDADTLDAQEVEDILDYLATALEQAYTHQMRVDRFVKRTRQLKDKGQRAPLASEEIGRGRVVSRAVYGRSPIKSPTD